MRIVTKFAIVLAALVGLSTLLNLVALNVSVGHSFAVLEEQDARDDHARVLEAIARQQNQARASASDYGMWDETVALVKGERPDYVAKYITPQSLASLNANYIVVVDRAGKIHVNEGYDFSGVEPIVSHLVAADAIPSGDPLLEPLRNAEPRLGLLRTKEGLNIVAASPIRLVSDKGEPSGVLAIAAHLDAGTLAAVTKVALEIEPVGATVEAMTAKVALVDDDVRITTTLVDLYGQPLAQLVTKTPRSITALGTRTIWMALGLLALVAAGIAMTLGWFLDRVALSRLGAIRRHLVDVADAGDLVAMPPDGRKDELSEVVTAFNAMAGQLAELRDRLRKKDYDSGAADHAAAVMHNIRNAITPINAIAADLADKESAAWKSNLASAVSELRQPHLDAERAARLTQFLALSTERLMGESERRRADLTGIGEMVRQIAEMLNDHAATSRTDQRAEAVDPVVAFRHARRIVERRSQGLSLELPSSLPAVCGRAVLLSEVFANIFLNAAESIEAHGRGSGRITVAGTRMSRDDGDRLRITIADDGAGIAGEHLPRLFENGYSTKGQASRGLGLHWSANAVISMGGTISASSLGEGRGAEFIIDLPIASSTLADAA